MGKIFYERIDWDSPRVASLGSVLFNKLEEGLSNMIQTAKDWCLAMQSSVSEPYSSSNPILPPNISPSSFSLSHSSSSDPSTSSSPYVSTSTQQTSGRPCYKWNGNFCTYERDVGKCLFDHPPGIDTRGTLSNRSPSRQRDRSRSRDRLRNRSTSPDRRYGGVNHHDGSFENRNNSPNGGYSRGRDSNKDNENNGRFPRDNRNNGFGGNSVSGGYRGGGINGSDYDSRSNWNRDNSRGDNRVGGMFRHNDGGRGDVFRNNHNDNGHGNNGGNSRDGVRVHAVLDSQSHSPRFDSPAPSARYEY